MSDVLPGGRFRLNCSPWGERRVPEAKSSVAAPSLELAKLRALLPDMGTAGLGSAEASARQLRGKVLKLKLGFNPNSSSVGTTVFVMLWSLVASGAVLSLAAAVLAHRFARKGEPGNKTAVPSPSAADPGGAGVIS